MPRLLDGCQLVAVRSVTVQANAPPPAKRPGVMGAIKGNIGAAAAKKGSDDEKIAIEQKDIAKTWALPRMQELNGSFRRRGASHKKMLGVPGSRRRISPFALTGSLNRFTLV